MARLDLRTPALMSLSGVASVSRVARLDEVNSTQAVVRAWLSEDVPEVCLATADVQTAGRGRLERRWQAGPGQALMVSAGFRPPDLPMEQAWRVPAIVALSMLESAQELLGPLATGQGELALKWPNDVVVLRDGRLRKLGGVLSEGIAEGDRLAAVVVGIGVNVDWPAHAFPADLADAMWSLLESAGRPVDRDALFDTWLARLLVRYAALRAGSFDADAWAAAQVTTGSMLEIDVGRELITGRGVGIDAEDGRLLLESPSGERRAVSYGEVVSCRVDRLRADL